MEKEKAQVVKALHPEEIEEILSPDMGSVQKWGLPIMLVILAGVVGMLCFLKLPQTVTCACQVSRISGDSALLSLSDAATDGKALSQTFDVSFRDFAAGQYGKTSGRRTIAKDRISRRSVPAMTIALCTEKRFRLPLRKGMTYEVTIIMEGEPLLNIIFGSLMH